MRHARHFLAFFLAGTTAGLLTPSVAVATVDRPPRGVRAVYTSAVSDTSLRVHWYGAGGELDPDVVSYEVTVNPGSSAAPDGASPTATVPEGTGYEPGYLVSGLESGQPYTFTVRPRDAGGNVGPARSVTATTRVKGAYLMQSTDAFADTQIPRSGSSVSQAAVTVTAGGRVHAVVVTRSPDSEGRISYTRRTSTTGWSTPVVLAVHSSGASLAVSPSGAVAAAWTDTMTGGAYYRVRPAHSTTWGSVHRLTSVRLTVLGLVLDGTGHLHVLVYNRDGQHYLTNAGGSWHHQLVGGTTARNDSAGELAYDPVTDQVVLLDLHVVPPLASGLTTTPGQPAELRLAHASARATSMPTPVTRITATGTDIAFLSPHVAAYGGRITVVAQEVAYRDRRITPVGIFVASGRTVATVGGWRRLDGTTETDAHPVVSAYSDRAISVAWSRVSPTWDTAVQGVWNAVEWVDAAGAWTVDLPRQATTSAYDVPVGSYHDASGHRYAATMRGDNATELASMR